MAYDHGMDQVRLDPGPVTGVGLSLTTIGNDLGAFSPAIQPIEIRGVSITVTTTCTVTVPVIGFYKRPVAGATGGAVLIKSVTTAAIGSWTAGNTIYAYLDDTSANDLIIRPGEDVFCEVITAPTAGVGFASIMYAPSWDTPLNDTSMVAST